MMSFDGKAQELATRELTTAYRSCPALKTHVALAAVLCGHPDSRAAIEQRMNEYSRKRWKSQPAAPSAGCMFKNPASIPAGRLIDELGLKGARAGGALVSAEHGNFIVNDGSATARDILELIEIIRQRVRAERGIELETEVEIVGE
jgi:UDP-N-acetylenolpyruvoylglucosamine reductase